MNNVTIFQSYILGTSTLIPWAPTPRKPKHGRKAKKGQPLGGRSGRAYRAR